MRLSKRMLAVAGLVPRGVTACDVGCDHGFVAIYLIRENICPKVIAMDIHKGPLKRAKEHIEQAGFSSYIETRLSDGIAALDTGEAECMIAAGMGGRLVVKIIRDGLEKIKKMPYLVLQPQSQIAFVREFLRKQGFLILKEDMVLEDGKFYPMMLVGTKRCGKAEKGGKKDSDWESLEDEFGPCLIKDKNPVLLRYLAWLEEQQNTILKEVQKLPERRPAVEKEIERIRTVRGYIRHED